MGKQAFKLAVVTDMCDANLYKQVARCPTVCSLQFAVCRNSECVIYIITALITCNMYEHKNHLEITDKQLAGKPQSLGVKTNCNNQLTIETLNVI